MYLFLYIYLFFNFFNNLCINNLILYYLIQSKALLSHRYDFGGGERTQYPEDVKAKLLFCLDKNPKKLTYSRRRF